MYSPDEVDAREAARLSKALQGKLTSQGGSTTNKRPVSSKWDPVQIKSIPGIPVNSTSSNNLTSDFGSLSVGVSSNNSNSSSGVDTSSPYSNSVNVPISDDKLKLEQQRLKKWGLQTADDDTNIPSYQPQQSQTNSLNKSSSVTFNASGDIVYSNSNSQPSTPQKIVPSASTENLVDQSSILGNVDSHTSSEKMQQEAKRLERWGLKINTNSISTPSTSSTSSTPAQTVTTPSSQSIPSSPYTSSAAQSVSNGNNSIQVASVQQFLDRVVFGAKSVKLVLHKKATSVEPTIAVLMELVKESATFGINLNPENPMSFDISQNAGRLAGAVNELVVKSSQSDYNPKQILEEIQSYLGQLYLAVVAN